MTPKQRKCYDFIERFWRENRYGPSYQEITDAMGGKSASGAWRMVKSMIDEGVLVVTENHSRSVRPASMEWPPNERSTDT